MKQLQHRRGAAHALPDVGSNSVSATLRDAGTGRGGIFSQAVGSRAWTKGGRGPAPRAEENLSRLGSASVETTIDRPAISALVRLGKTDALRILGRQPRNNRGSRKRSELDRDSSWHDREIARRAARISTRET